uniref:RILP-like protein 2 n=1 Tax=Leptobrachium leishanense TaxID=445787 RepID=A0A8C5PBU6_9ANUR
MSRPDLSRAEITGARLAIMEESEPLWSKAPATLSVKDVYSMAVCLGSELQGLADQYGLESVSGMVPQVVRVLELLEGYVERGRERSFPEEELLVRAVQSMQSVREQRPYPDVEQRLLEAQRKEHELQNQLSQLTEENQKLLGQLAESKSQEECAAREERDLMLRLKKAVDMQRDEIRALSHDNTQKSKDTEALQEQLNRFMKMNEDLRRKVSILQAQLKSALQSKTDLEIVLQDQRKENERLSHRNAAPAQIPDKNMNTTNVCAESQSKGEAPSSQPCFTMEDVKQIVEERNELKTNLFLVNEELQYYQRELLTDERIPGFLLCGMKAAIQKQRKKIKAKMLGIVESPTSSDDEETTWTQPTSTDCVDSEPPDSKIKSLGCANKTMSSINKTSWLYYNSLSG